MKSFDEVLAFSCAVDGQGIIDHSNCTCNSSEFRVFIPPVMELKPGACVVEIGVFTGRSASVYLQLQPDLNLDIHLIDNWSWHAAMATEYFHKMVLTHFNEVPFTYHHTWSQRLGLIWEKPINFLYIDGWHDLAGVEPDCQLWLPHVVPGGVVAFHDSDWKDVADCIEKYVRSQGWELLGSAERMTVWRKPA